LTISRESEAGGLELRLCGECEDEVAGLSRVRWWDIEVEEGGDLFSDGAKVDGSVRRVWLRRIDWDNQVGNWKSWGRSVGQPELGGAV